MNEEFIERIKDVLFAKEEGSTIQSVMDKTGLARGTVKSYLDYLVGLNRVYECVYGQNTKVYFLNKKVFEYGSIDVGRGRTLFVDFLATPFKEFFVRVLYRSAGRDISSITLNSEESVDDFIKILKGAKKKFVEVRGDV